MVRLLTFSRLSLLRERQGLSEVLGAVDRLSTVSRSFDCHLLQHAAGFRPLDMLGTSDQQHRLQAVLGDSPPDVAIVTPHLQCESVMPEWMAAKVIDGAMPETAAEVVRTLGDQSDRPLVWRHVELPAGDAQWQYVVACLGAASKIIPGIGGDALLVTATAGEGGDTGRFETLLWEEIIRVPLWIAGANMRCGRQPQVTGSFDVLETILALLGAASRDDSQNCCDLTCQRDSDDLEDRSIIMHHDLCDAVRTSDFLFVRRPSDSFGEQTALYGKPHDVWNVHDLQREYPQVAEELLAQLEGRDA